MNVRPDKHLYLPDMLRGLSWPWLSGQSSHLDLARAGVSIIAFGICMLSWKHVKAMNRAAHLAIQQEIEKTKTAAEFAN